MTTTRAPRRRILMIVLIGAALVAMLLIASLTRPDQSEPDATAEPSASQQPESEASAEPPEANAVPDMARRIDGDVAAIGAVDAPLVLVEYADYRCPYCGIFAMETLPQIIDEYVDAGKVRIEWRDIPLFGEDSLNAAVAARAAGQQGRFWEYQHAVYAFQVDGRKDLPRELLLRFADETGVADLAAFEAALDDAALQQAVIADAREAQALGVQSTPSFLIGQTPVMGAQPIEAFRQVIDAELARVAG